MPIIFTRPAEQRFDNDFKARITDVYSFFPELREKRIVCGMITGRRSIQGVAISWAEPPLFRLRPKVSLYTIAHELTHLVQGNDSHIPHGETACDIWTIDRMPVEYLDQNPNYLLARISVDWNANRVAIKKLCREAIEIRGSMRNYIKWIRHQIKEL